MALVILPTCLLAAGKTVKVICGICPGCPSNNCYAYHGTNLTYHSCITICDLQGQNTVIVNDCAVDYLGLVCETKLCFFKENLVMSTPLGETQICTPSSQMIETKCSTKPKQDCKSDLCTSCMLVIKTQIGQASVTNPVCMSTYNAICADMAPTLVEVTDSMQGCRMNSFGMMISCCKTYNFQNYVVGMCTNNIPVFLTQDTTTKLSAQIASEAMCVLYGLLAVSTLFI